MAFGRSQQGTLKGVSQSNGLAHRDIEIFALARGAGSLYRIDTDESLEFINSFTSIVIFPHSAVQRVVRYR